MPSPSRSFSNQMGPIPDACLVDHDSIPRLAVALEVSSSRFMARVLVELRYPGQGRLHSPLA
jgi:hypothetical protein